MSRDTGGAAFPCMPPQDTAAGSAVGYPHPEGGMSLRDYFAAKALQGLLANPKLAERCVKAGGATSGYFEANAYAFADGMLAERAK